MSQCVQILSNDLHQLNLDQDYMCPVCRETAAENPQNNRWFYHSDDLGGKHPIHRNSPCINYTKEKGKCAVCNKSLDLSTLTTLRERFFDGTKELVTDLLNRSVKFFIPSFIIANIAEIAGRTIFGTTSGVVGQYVLTTSVRIFGNPALNLAYLVFTDNPHTVRLSKVISIALAIFTIALNYDYLLFLDTKGIWGSLIGTTVVCGAFYSIRFGPYVVDFIDRIIDRLPV